MKTRRIILGLAFLALLLPMRAGAQIQVPPIFGDHMVLQSGRPILWGKAKAGSRIRAKLGTHGAEALTGPRGDWKLAFENIPPGGPHTLKLSGDGTLAVKDVLVGDVWLGSGQSNMALPMSRTDNADREIAMANFPKIRFFEVKRAVSFEKKDQVDGHWEICSPGTAAAFSAVSYFFARSLHRRYRVPVGLIVSAWGGSPIETWTPRPSMEAEPRLKRRLAILDSMDREIRAWKEGLPFELWLKEMRLSGDFSRTIGLERGGGDYAGDWSASAGPRSTATVDFPQRGVLRFSGRVFGGGWASLQSPLAPGKTDQDFTGYRSIDFDFKGHGRFRLRLEQPGVKDFNYHGTDILEPSRLWEARSEIVAQFHQGNWGTSRPFTQDKVRSISFFVDAPFAPEVPGIVYRAMVEPLAGLSVQGVIWYQGESNTQRPRLYQAQLEALISGWRGNWGRDLPFIIIQLPNYMDVQAQPTESGWAALRHAQAGAVEATTQTALVCTLGLGEADDIHPSNKQGVAERLDLAARRLAYGERVQASGPVLVSARFEGKKVRLRFAQTAGGLRAAGESLKGFALAGPDGRFAWARAKITRDDQVDLEWDWVRPPVRVRYAWADNPVATLENEAGLPALPFEAVVEGAP